VIGKIAAQTAARSATRHGGLQIAAAEPTRLNRWKPHMTMPGTGLQCRESGTSHSALSQAVQFDSNFGRAYAGLAAVSANIGNSEKRRSIIKQR